jgi:quercetin dioxygenase-like cupin family protein
MSLKSLSIAALAAALLLCRSASAAEPAPGVSRVVLQQHDLKAPGYEAVMADVRIAAGAREGRHSHPAEVFLYMLEGTLTLEVEGKPTTLKTGDSYFIGRGLVHEGINRGTVPVRLVAVFATEKDKPLIVPAR